MAEKLTEAALCFEADMKELGLLFEREFQFFKERKWRADYLVRPLTLVEIDGGAFTQGRHTRGAGFIADMEKLNTASALGYKVFRFTPQQVLKGEAREFIRKWLYFEVART